MEQFKDDSGWVNIGAVVDSQLCTQCGVCAAACPHRAVIIERNQDWCFYPRVTDSSRCAGRCKRICLSVCAGVHEDPSLWKKRPIHFSTYDEFCVGNIRSTWVGYSTDEGIRHRGASGGVVVGLLAYLLESGKIDGALVVSSDTVTPLQHEMTIARSRVEIEESWGSKYYPLPLGARFRDLNVENQRFAVVLLGCQMRSLRLLENKWPKLRKSIVLRIGLICGYCAGFKAVVDQAFEWGIKDPASIQRIDFREGKWPGNVRIRSSGTDRRTIIYDFLGRIPFTTNRRCLICSDLMNETADVTVGDAWLPELTSRKDEGWSIIAARTPDAEAMIESAHQSKALHLEPMDEKDLIRSQMKPLRYKKEALMTRLYFVQRRLGGAIPKHDFNRYRKGFRTNMWNRIGNRALLVTAHTFFSRDRLRRWLFRFVPRGLTRWYVKSIFLMIAHDGRGSLLARWIFNREPFLNCDK